MVVPLIGDVDRFSGRPGERIAIKVSSQLDAPYGFRTDLTPYARWGDWLAWLCVIAALMLLLLSVRDAFASRDSFFAGSK